MALGNKINQRAGVPNVAKALPAVRSFPNTQRSKKYILIVNTLHRIETGMLTEPSAGIDGVLETA